MSGQTDIYRKAYTLVQELTGAWAQDVARRRRVQTARDDLAKALDDAYAANTIAEDERLAIEEHADGLHKGQTTTTAPDPDRCALCAMPDDERAAAIALGTFLAEDR